MIRDYVSHRVFNGKRKLTESAVAQLRLLIATEGDECDCPACEPRCRKEGKPCFILCSKCSGKPEEDDFGPLNSRSTRVSIDG